MRRLGFVCAIATLLFDITLGSHVMGQTPGRVEAKTITLGIVAPMNQKEVEEHFRDFVRYVARKLSSAPPIEGRVVVTSTQSQLANLLTERKVDFYMESPYPTYLINSVYGAGKLLLRRWKGGMAEYYALIFTKRNSETKRLEDLRGKIIAFEDPDRLQAIFSRSSFFEVDSNPEKTRMNPMFLPGKSVTFCYSQDKLTLGSHKTGGGRRV
jgi:phosphonate transport system substrate-binding protein